jgi:hypothetical protein
MGSTKDMLTDVMYEIVYQIPSGYIHTVQGLFAGVKDNRLYYDVEVLDKLNQERTERMSINLDRCKLISTRFIPISKQDD